MNTKQLIGAMYEGVGTPEGLNPVLADIARSTNSTGVQWGMFDHQGHWKRTLAVGLDQGVVDAYVQKYELRDPRMEGWLRRPGEMVPCHETVPDQRAFERSPIVNEFLNPFDSRYCLATLTQFTPTLFLGFGLLRGRRYGPFEKYEATRVQQLLPHLQRALGACRA